MYADMLRDDDYYGCGVCHWRLTEARVALRARADANDTRFVHGLRAQKVFAGASLARYFWKGYYPRFKQGGGFADFGNADLKAVPADKLDEFFSVTLSAKEMAR